MSTTSDHAAVPGFRPTTAEEEDPWEGTGRERPPSSPPSSSPVQSGTRPQEPSPAEPTSHRTSTRRSTDPDVDEVLGALAAGTAQVLSVVANKAVRRRAGVPTTRWLMTEDEAKALGEPLGKMATRKAPDAVTEGDGPDLVAAAAAILIYAARNLAGVSADEFDATVAAARVHDAQHPAEAQPAPAPAPAPVVAAVVPHEPEATGAPAMAAQIQGVAPAMPSGVPAVL